MPLTPADVHSVAFTKASTSERGYDEEHVDAFLDDVVAELTRLMAENDRLRARVELDRLEREKASAERAAREIRTELERARTGSGERAGSDRDPGASRVLTAATRTAADHVAEARREADEVLSTARRTAEQVSVAARTKADTLERDARQRHRQAMRALSARRAAAQKDIEELTGLRREYRGQLKAHLEGQLLEVDGHGQNRVASDATTRT